MTEKQEDFFSSRNKILSNERQLKAKRTIKRLGVSQLILGSNCFTIGSTLVLGYGMPQLIDQICCGLVIMICGALGIVVGSERSKPCLIHTYIGVTVFGALGCAAMFVWDFILMFSPWSISITSAHRPFVIVVVFLVFIAMILLIVGSCICGCVLEQNCLKGCVEKRWTSASQTDSFQKMPSTTMTEVNSFKT